jgi:AraC-like DNA-binding protein
MSNQVTTLHAQRLSELASLTERFSSGDGIHDTAVKGLRCIKLSAPNARLPSAYEPSICVILQGSKRVLLDEEIYRYEPPQFLAVSVDLPLLGQVLEASEQRPYLCLQIAIDSRQISELMAQSTEHHLAGSGSTRGLFVGTMDDATQEAVLRLTRLLDTPKDIPMLAPLVFREVHYRLLTGAYGSVLAQIAIAGSTMQRIGQIIRKLKSDLAAPVRIEELAALANMSTSSFHQHFKAVTAMSPLQYCKRLRLTEARHILLSEKADAASVAYRVGYESTSQFSREYARMFGAPPIRDIETLREVR